MTGRPEAPRISIIISNYNYGRFLRDTVDSALGQTYRHVEVIVVDDGSTDDSRQILKSYGSRISAIYKENGGQSSAFNVGFAASGGDIVIFLDSDDMLVPHTAERVSEHWRPGISKVQYRLRVIDADGNPQDRLIPPAHLSMPSGDLKKEVLSKGTYITPYCSGNAYGRQMLNRIFPVPEADHRLYGDAYLLPLAALYGDIVSLDEELGLYRIHGGNTWSHRTIDSRKFMIDVLNERGRKTYIRKAASEAGLRVSFTDSSLNSVMVIKELAVMILDPSTRKALGGSVGRVVYQGIGTIWKEPGLGLMKRLAGVMFILSCPLFPRSVAPRLFQWYLYAEFRPSVLGKLFGRVP